MAMNAYRNYNNNTSALSSNLEKLSSGYKINRAGDDAAGLAISEKMRAQISGLDQASSNVKDGISLVKTGEGALQEVQDMLNRMVTLATQSANGTYDEEVDRDNLQKEVTALKSEIDRIADSANFNGIKLLDGSLESSQVIDSIEIAGKKVDYEESDAAKGKYVNTQAFDQTNTGTVSNGDTISFSVGLSDGTVTTVKFTVGNYVSGTSTTKNDALIAEDGTVYQLAATSVADTADMTDAILAELKKTNLNDTYTITANAGKVTLESKEAGTDTPEVVSFDFNTKVNGANSNIDMGRTISVEARDAGYEIKASSIQVYDGNNYDKAVFEINGHKFVVLATVVDASSTDWLHATQALGDDVTVLIGGSNALLAGQDNFAQNIEKIASVTGLKVTDAIKEGVATAAKTGSDGTDNKIDAGKGIRLTLDKNYKTETGGLKLQIGDTADSFNQLKVSIEDMHSAALGIADIDISTQDAASTAIDVIKKAINSVSSTRGTLGATQNRLEHTSNNLSVMTENIQDAESTIRDTDVAEEMMSYTKNNILVQSAQAMLAQANSVPQGVLQLLQ
jgi:flagellin